MPINVYKEKYVTFYARGGKKTIDCKIPGCKKTMDWDRSKIMVHFKKNHPMVKLRAYYEEYIKRKQVLFHPLSQMFSKADFVHISNLTTPEKNSIIDIKPLLNLNHVIPY